MKNVNLLVVDDENLIRWSIKTKLSKEGYNISVAKDAEEALALFKEREFDIVLLDIRLPGMDGMELLEKIKSDNKNIEVIMITALGVIDLAVKAIKLGAYDYITKPFDMEELIVKVKKVIEVKKLRERILNYSSNLSNRYTLDRIVGKSEEIISIKESLKKVIDSDVTTVLLLGETGTGKDLVARVIHYSSKRARNQFVELNCSALPENLFESELFGFEKGAFTDARSSKKGLLEIADNGTLYLDEIGDMPYNMQSKLLKVIDYKTFRRLGSISDIKIDTRIIAASNRNIENAVKENSFRLDLFYRLNVFPLHLPPLRERREDIPLLVEHFLKELSYEFKKKEEVKITEEAVRLLKSYLWPGNVRELKNVLERAFIIAGTNIITVEHISFLKQKGKDFMQQQTQTLESIEIPSTMNLQEIEKRYILKALALSSYNQKKAAKLLGITRDTLRYRLKKYGIPFKES